MRMGGGTYVSEGARQQGKIRAWGVSQDEGLEMDFAGRFAPEGVDQLRSDVLHPSPRPAHLTFAGTITTATTPKKPVTYQWL